jgi:hypothetical protein
MTVMINLDEKKLEIDEAFKKVAESARAFNEDLMAMRSIELPAIDELNNEDRTELMKIGRDLDMRTAFILRSLLAQHGNVLWM